jgi:hypothetical protein
MIRRLNYTGRRRIPASNIQLRLTPDSPPRFEAAVQLAGMDFPADAQVFLDVGQGASTTTRRFSLGTVGAVVSPPDCSLAGFQVDSIQFEVKVVSPGGEHVGRLLGVSTPISPRRPGDPEATAAVIPLLPVQVVELGPEVWKVQFDQIRPRLLLNSRIAGIVDIARTNGAFFGLVYPAIVRTILTRILLVEDMTEAADDDDSWQSLWLRWATARHPDHTPAGKELEERMGWTDEVANAFCGEKGVLGLFMSGIGQVEAES